MINSEASGAQNVIHHGGQGFRNHLGNIEP